jgi:diguanylate cyclase (GGDEF)-like protein
MTFQRLANSIVTRLLMLGVAIALVGGVARYYLLSDYLREDLGAVVSTQQSAMAAYVAADIDANLQARSTMLRQMATALPVELLTRPDDLRNWLGERYVLQPLFSQGLFVTDLAGRPIADYPLRPERALVRYDDRDYIQAAIKGQQLFGRPIVGRVASEPILPLASPIRDAAGQVRGVLVGITGLSARGFITLPAAGVLGEGSGFLVVSTRDQLFVASSDPQMVLKPTPAAGINLLHDRAMAGYRGSGITVNAQGAEEIAAIASVPTTDWFVVARIPTAQALATVQRAQRYVKSNGVTVLLAYLLLAGGGLLFIFKPLFKAADHADRMTRGEIPLESLPVARHDEVGHLTQAFNRLLDKLKTQQADLERLAHHDPLTGLPNRILLADRLAQVLNRAHRNGTSVAVLYLDLDGFKPINDVLGHAAGDQALQEVARRLLATVRESDTLARIGGDEFLVLMGDLDADPAVAREAVQAVARKCLSVFEDPIGLGDSMRTLGVSVGVVVGNGNSTIDALRKAADVAMYQAKQAGGQRVVMAPHR